MVGGRSVSIREETLAACRQRSVPAATPDDATSQAIVRSLRDRHGAEVADEKLVAAASNAMAKYGQAPVRQFVPILAMREAERLVAETVS